MSGITLSKDQQYVYDEFVKFLHSEEEVMVISGYAGTGKSTLTKTILEHIPKLNEARKLISETETAEDPWNVMLTATTNKAAEALSAIAGQSVSTIHSALGLRVQKDWKSGETRLVAAKPNELVEDRLIFIDEASFLDRATLELIFQQTNRCKIVFIGDPAQILGVKSPDAPVFNAGFKEVRLTEVMRQAKGNPIIDLATQFREMVNTGEWFSFTPDGVAIQHLSGDRFEEEILKEFTRKDWKNNDSKICAWTNKRVIEFNHYVNERAQGIPELQAGDYAVCNRYIKNKSCNIRTDETVLITDINPAEEYDVRGWSVQMNMTEVAFLPASRDDYKQALKAARANSDYSLANYIENNWIDLRAAYACTLNKSQGSTYDKVFIDLNDVSKCRNNNQLARLLYVGVSRARHNVYLTGDIT